MQLWTAFLLGFIGSAHCAGMCGPLALALPQSGSTRAKFFTGRLAYNLGRLVTYGALGLVFGLFGKTVFLAGLQRTLSITLGLSLLTGLLVSRRLALWRPVTALVNQLKAQMSGLLRRRSFTALTLLGLLNGLLPCGLVYVACAGATATNGAISGILFMAAFGAGTLPMMLALSLSGKLVPFSLRLKLLTAVPVSVCMLAALLILRGLSLGVPYLSPDISADHPVCCQK